MERVLNDEDKLKRAEEIILRRNNKNISFPDRRNFTKKRYLGSKIGFQILILFNLALIVFCVQYRDFIFRDEFINYIISYEGIINNKINELINIDYKTNDDLIVKQEGDIENEELNDMLDSNTGINEEINSEDIKQNEEVVSSMSQMDIDIENLKSTYNFIKPVSGTVTSIFGARESENKNIEGYHTGIDIGAEKGTSIKSSFNGIVTMVSNDGDYGKHLKVRCNNVTLLYAHCSKILVKEGDFVEEGQEIAKVGSTGNSTGPHLHFEIRVDDRYVDPRKIIEF